MKLPSGDLTETDEDNAKVFAKHFGKVLNKKKSINNNVLNNINSREVMNELDVPTSWKEFTEAAKDLTNNKYPGLNGVTPNAFKAMSPENLKSHFNFILKFSNDNLDFEEWHEGQVVPVSKNGDLSYSNKRRGANLMDIGSNIFSSLLCKRLFSIIKKHGVKYQFGSSPGVGYQDGTFTIKTLLHTRYNHDLPTYVAFVDLVKAFDTVDHTLMLQILKNYGAPPKLRSSIARMYQDLKAVIKIGKTEETMSQTVGVRQGDCMSPVLFLFMVMVFDETLEKEWTRSGLNMIALQQHSHSPQDIGKLTGHKAKKSCKEIY